MNQKRQPPEWALQLLASLLAPHLREGVEGDLLEVFEDRLKRYPAWRAQLLFIWDVVLLLRPTLLTQKPVIFLTPSPLEMFPSFFKATLRHLGRYKGYTFINVTGLVLSLTSSLLLARYVLHELSYEDCHQQSNQLYRLVVDRHYADSTVQSYATSSLPLGPALKAEAAEVEAVARVLNPKWLSEKVLLGHGNQRFYEERFFFADPAVFELFTYSFLLGDPRTALSKTNAVVISQQMARKYFGAQNPLGQTLRYQDRLLLEVTGVVENVPLATHLKTDFIAPFTAFSQAYGTDRLKWWGWDLAYTYVRLPRGYNSDRLAEKLPAFFRKHTADLEASRGFTYSASLQSLKQIHLDSQRPWELETGGSRVHVNILLGLIGFLLLVSAINFLNLSAALSFKRVTEIGVRKVLGASRLGLFSQFMGESGVLLGFALALSWGLFWLGLPAFGQLVQLDLRLVGLPAITRKLVHLSAGASAGIALVAGLYLALRFARFHPQQLFRKQLLASGKASWFGQGLVVVQFTVSLLLASGAVIAYQQITYLQEARLGFTKNNMLVLRTGNAAETSVKTLKEQLLALPQVMHVSGTSGVPGGKFERMRVRTTGGELLPVSMVWTDTDFARTLGLRVLKGRDFSARITTDQTEAYLVNQAAARLLGIDSLEGVTLEWPSMGGIRKGPVVGVVEDFHFASLREGIEPLVILVEPSYSYLLISLTPGPLPTALAGVAAVTRRVLPGRPFEYQFLDQQLAGQYQSERVLSRFLKGCTGVCLVVACMGLFALIALVIEGRMREMGIRKILGATAGQLLLLLTGPFMKLVVLAIILSWPLAYWLAQQWLEGFAYRIPFRGEVLVGVAGAGFVLALLAVSYHCIKAAFVNPTKFLRNE